MATECDQPLPIIRWLIGVSKVITPGIGHGVASSVISSNTADGSGPNGDIGQPQMLISGGGPVPGSKSKMKYPPPRGPPVGAGAAAGRITARSLPVLAAVVFDQPAITDPSAETP